LTNRINLCQSSFINDLPMKKLLLIIVFMIFAPINIITSLLALGNLSNNLSVGPVYSSSPPQQLYAALPMNSGEVLGTMETGDARPIIINKYLLKYNSPLQPYADFIVTVSDKYSLDWRLLVAIAQQESNLGKKIPEGSFNAWGWGIHSEGTLKFFSWEEAIETVAKGIKENYVDKGYQTPEEIMGKYTPLSNGSWAYGVNQFLNELEYGKVN
jgi:hypothetical protein